MGDSESSSLVIVRDFRNRARDEIPNGNLPVGTVGPEVAAGFGDTHVMYPASNPPVQASAWNGWPLGWGTPWDQMALPKKVSTLWTCIDLNTRQLASFPVYGMRGLALQRLPEWSNNPEPGTYSDWTEAAKQIFNTLQACGETILWCVGRYKDGPGGTDGSVARFVVLNPNWVNIEKANGETVYELQGDRLDNRDVCHIKYQSSPGNLRGIGPLEWCAQSVMGAAAMERYATDLATNGGIPWGVIKSNRHLNGDDANALKDAWVASSHSRSGAPAVLSGDLTLDTLSISPKDMALLDLRVFDETRIAAAFGVPPFLIGLPQPSGLTYANASSLFDYHWRSTLRVLASTVASAISAWALPRGQRLEFNREAYTQASPYERAQTYQLLFNMVDEKGNRAITIDEIRMAERYLPNEPDADLQALAEGTINT